MAHVRSSRLRRNGRATDGVRPGRAGVHIAGHSHRDLRGSSAVREILPHTPGHETSVQQCGALVEDLEAVGDGERVIRKVEHPAVLTKLVYGARDAGPAGVVGDIAR